MERGASHAKSRPCKYLFIVFKHNFRIFVLLLFALFPGSRRRQSSRLRYPSLCYPSLPLFRQHAQSKPHFPKFSRCCCHVCVCMGVCVCVCVRARPPHLKHSLRRERPRRARTHGTMTVTFWAVTFLATNSTPPLPPLSHVACPQPQPEAVQGGSREEVRQLPPSQKTQALLYVLEEGLGAQGIQDIPQHPEWTSEDH